MSFKKLVNKYEESGYKKRGYEKTKFAEEWYGAKLKKGLFSFGFEGVYIYHVKGNVKPVHMNEFLKEYQRLYEKLQYTKSKLQACLPLFKDDRQANSNKQ